MWVVPAAGHLIRYNGEGLREQQGKSHDGDKEEEDENDNNDGNDNVQNSVYEIGGGAHRDAKSVSWDSLQGDVVELPGNPLTTLSIRIIFMVRIIFWVRFIFILMIIFSNLIIIFFVQQGR